MKKILIILSIAVMALTAISCQKDPIGNTATVETAGQWYVTVDAVDASGNLPDPDYADFFGMGQFILLTANTAANKPNEMLVNDLGTFWEFNVKVACDQNNLTFGNSEAVENLAYECMVSLFNGKIVKDGATTPSGMKADAIQFEISFDDDTYPEKYGYDHYLVHGYRYTGLANDD